ncbi:GAF domain-containing protein [Roseivivax sp. CAU 1761]
MSADDRGTDHPGDTESLLEHDIAHAHGLTGPFGSAESWDAGFRSAVETVQASAAPMWLAWGDDNALICNAALRSLLPGTAPAHGVPADRALAGLWPGIGGALDEVRNRAAGLELPGNRRDGVTGPRAVLTPLAAADGRRRGVLGVVLDIPGGAERNAEMPGERLEALHRRLLELTLQETPLDTVLTELVQALCESTGRDPACSILLTDASGTRLTHGAAVGLSEAYCRAVDGVPVAEGAGSCGTAAHRRQGVQVADIATDPLWQEYRDLALREGLRACWSHPILGRGGELLGTFAVYDAEPGLPGAEFEGLIEFVAQTTALILERYAAQHALSDQKRLLETLNRVGAGIAAELDHDAIVQMVTDAGVELTGAAFGAFFYNVIDATSESYMLYALSGAAREAFAAFPMPRNTAIFKPTFEGTGIVRSDDITRDPRYGRNRPHHGMPKGHLPVRSYLAVPVISRSGEVIGGLLFGHPEPGRFSDHHERLMEGIAGQAAIAVDNARLYQAAQREIEVRRKAEQDLRRTQADLEDAQERVELALAAGAIVGTWVLHIPTGRMTTDERFARTFGLDPERCHSGYDVAEAIAAVHPDDRDRAHAVIAEASRRGGEFRAEYRVRQRDGSYRWIEASGRCDLDAEGHAIRFPGVLIDIEQRRRIEIDLRRREADLALLLDATADGFYAVDPEGRTTRCNAAFLRMLGFEREEDVVGKQLHEIIHHSHADGSHYPRAQCPIYRVAATGEMAHVDDEVFFRTDGSVFPVEYWVRPVIWQGELQGAVCTIVDISERKRAEEARQLLLRELNHRVKNLFSITSGMIQMTARSASSVEGMAAALSGRLMSLARAHELITSSLTARADHVAPSRLDALIATVMEPHVEGRDAAFRQSGPEVEIGPSAATSFALILHELATNAAKYGALSVAEGRVEVAWDWHDDTLQMTWRESAGPAIAGPPQRDGFGSQLARLSASGQLGGSIVYDWRPDGVEIRLAAARGRLAS